MQQGYEMNNPGQPAHGHAGHHHGGAQGGPPGPFKEGFCGCFGDIKSCLIGYCAPCVLYGMNVNELNGGGTGGPCFKWCCLGCCGLCWIAGMGTRGEIRARYNIEGSGGKDCFAHACCGLCALTQESREIKLRKAEGGK